MPLKPFDSSSGPKEPAAIQIAADANHVGQAGDQKPPEQHLLLHDILLEVRIVFCHAII